MPTYKRVLLKLSGEALMGPTPYGIDFETVDRITAEIKAVHALGAEVCLVIGGGNTAIDMAVQIKRLGAEEVTLVYRRGAESMSATEHEQAFAKENGVVIRHWAQPLRLEGEAGHVRRAVFQHTMLDQDSRLVGSGEQFALEADMVFKAIGQVFVADPIGKHGGS